MTIMTTTMINSKIEDPINHNHTAAIGSQSESTHLDRDQTLDPQLTINTLTMTMVYH
jgi:hypothetical protein